MEWISIEDRYPDDLIPVLVMGECDEGPRNGYDVCWRYSESWASWFCKNITHWMPLPSKPEGHNGDTKRQQPRGSRKTK